MEIPEGNTTSLDPFISDILSLAESGMLTQLNDIQKRALEKVLESTELSDEDRKRIQHVLYFYESINIADLVMPRFKEYLRGILYGFMKGSKQES